MLSAQRDSLSCMDLGSTFLSHMPNKDPMSEASNHVMSQSMHAAPNIIYTQMDCEMQKWHSCVRKSRSAELC